MNPRELMESFVRLSMLEREGARALRSLLCDDFRYLSPLEELVGADRFLRDAWRIPLESRAVEIRSVLGDAEPACVAYEMDSLDPDMGRIAFTDWFTFADGKIREVRSNFDAAQLRENAVRI